MIGWSNVGKTVYLQSLTLLLERVGRIWPNFVPAPATEATFGFVQGVRAAMAGGNLPPITPLGVHEAYIMLLKNMERWGGRTLVIRDFAGEHFQRFEIPPEQASFLLNAQTAFVMFSFAELSQHPEWSMDDLLHSYINTLLKLGVNLRRQTRNLVVIFSKCDLMHDLPPHLSDYLLGDELWAAIDGRSPPPVYGATKMAEYMERLNRIDAEIKAWLETTENGFKLTRRAADMGIQIRFTIASATGAEVSQENRLSQRLEPRRILDPFFWALEFERQR
jgi:hypothetical protein